MQHFQQLCELDQLQRGIYIQACDSSRNIQELWKFTKNVQEDHFHESGNSCKTS